MECGGSSNPMKRYPTNRASTTGIVIQEGRNTTANNPTDVANLINLQKSFKRDADQYMPIANVIRIMRRILPPHAKIADDAKETIQECVSEFISFVTTEANERCHREYRKTITPDDVLSAMGSLGFDSYIEPLTAFLDKYRSQDPERSPMNHHAPYARRRVHRPATQMARTPAPAPPFTFGGNYLPTLPTTTYAVDYRGNYVGLPPQMGGYFTGNQGGGEGSSGGAEFDPFAQ